MLASLTLILVCQLVGELTAGFFGLPVPGPVLGMVLLFLILGVRGRISEPLKATADGLLGHLSLLFIPAGVGVMAHLSLLEADWLPITVALLVSTLLTIAVTGFVMVRLDRMTGHTSTEADDA